MSKPAIPKFGSFKPKEEKEAKEDSSPARIDVESTDNRHERSYRRKWRYHDTDREREYKKSRHQTPVEQITNITTKSNPGLNSEISGLYTIDTIGDSQNLVYGRVHRYNIPPFYRFGSGCVLGVNKALKIDRDSLNNGKGIILVPKSNRVGQREKYAFSRMERKGQRLLRVLPQQALDDSTNADFIPFQLTRKQKTTGSGSDDGSDTTATHYRSIEGKAKPSARPAGEDLEYVTDSESSEFDSSRISMNYNEILRQKTIDLSKAVELHPEEMQGWLDLISHQDSLLGQEDQGQRKITSAEKRSTTDIKIHLFEKAIQKAGSNPHAKERLLLGLMEEGSKIWDFKTQSERWESISSGNPDSLILCQRYLDFHQKNFNTFQYEKTRNMYLTRIQILKSATHDAKKSLHEQAVLREHLVYTILRATLCIREAGFTELATGIWQGLLELNTTKIDSLDMPKIELLQEFWELESLRIGEDGALGLKQFHLNKATAVIPDAKVDPEATIAQTSKQDLFSDWSKAEKFRAYASQIPARTMDDVMEDDPFRVILWSDIVDFMFDFTDPLPQHETGTELLVNAFLMFCRLPPNYEDLYPVVKGWWNDSLVRGELLEADAQLLQGHYIAHNESSGLSTRDDSSINRRSMYVLIQNFVPTPDILFPLTDQFRYMTSWRQMYGSEASAGPVKYTFVRNVLRSLVTSGSLPGLAEYMLAFELRNEPDIIKKTAKNVLKQYPASIQLYNCYAMIEISRGHIDAGVGVLRAAMSMQNFKPSEKDHVVQLWKTWIWTLLIQEDLATAYKCLLLMPLDMAEVVKVFDEMNTTAPALLLRSRKFLVSMRDFTLSCGNSKHAATYAECIALLAYLSPDGTRRNIEDALGAFRNSSKIFAARQEISKGSTALELLYQSAARLMHFHITRSRSYRPVIVRDLLVESLSHFPQNTILLALYTFNESRLRIDDRVRSLLLTNVLAPGNDSLSSRLFAIEYETRSGNVHSIRAAFENAVSSPLSSSNAGLWRLYVLFCKSRREYVSSTKDVFYRGMRSCPWSKSFMMLAFEELRYLMTFAELKGVYRTLGEKELRVHVDLEDQLEEWDVARKPKRIQG